MSTEKIMKSVTSIYIWKILLYNSIVTYSSKEDIMPEYRCTLSSAQEFAKQEKLEEWVHAFLLSDGQNKGFSDGLKLFPRYFLGPVAIPISLLKRCCGPEANMKYRVNKEWFEKHVTELAEVIKRVPDMAPLIVHYLIDPDSRTGIFELNDSNHRLEAYSRLGITECYAIIWITEAEELERFRTDFPAL